MEKTDKDIIRDIKSGDAKAMEELLAGHRKNVHNIIYSMGFDYNDAMDISQEVFIKILKCIRNFREESAFTTYLYRIVVNTSYDYKKKKGRIETNFSGSVYADEDRNRAKEPVPADPDVGEDFIQKEIMAEYFKKAISGLTDRQRYIFMLKHWGSFKIREIAKFLSISQSTVKTQLNRAFEKVKTNFEYDDDELKAHIA